MPDLLFSPAIQLDHVTDQYLGMSIFCLRMCFFGGVGFHLCPLWGSIPTEDTLRERALGMCLLITSYLGVSHDTKHGALRKKGYFNRITPGPGTHQRI
jgi:hypothetical protein